MKKLLSLVALIAASTASANGGLSIDTVEQHGNADQWQQTNSVAIEIVTQAPVDKFNAYKSNTRSVVDTDALRHNHNA